jgi:DNA-binding transcriptional regulator YdaS (Cro superfamily)
MAMPLSSAAERVRAAVDFDAFLRERDVTLDAAARALGTSAAGLGQIVNGQRRPNRRTTLAIEIWTNGRVSAAGWLTADELRSLARVRRYAEGASQ